MQPLQELCTRFLLSEAPSLEALLGPVLLLCASSMSREKRMLDSTRLMCFLPKWEKAFKQ